MSVFDEDADEVLHQSALAENWNPLNKPTPNIQQLALAKVDAEINRIQIALNYGEKYWNQELQDSANKELGFLRALRSVLELHKEGRDTDDSWCEECGEFRGSFPCYTASAIAKELGGI